MGEIFISYRRADSNHIAGRIYDRLAAHFGKDSLFKDVDNIRFGTDFRRTLLDAIDRCHVVLVVIGDQWLNIADESGQRRLHIDGDFVRMEIEAALERAVPIIPLMVGHASMPSVEDLPPSLKRLAYFNGTVIRPDPDFHHDVARLIRALEEYRDGKPFETARVSGDPVGPAVPTTARPHSPAVDVIELMRATKERALKAHAEARRLMEAEWDYAGAAALLEGLPVNLRDAALYSSLCERRDRVEHLDHQILEAVQSQDLENLRPKVSELLELTPKREDLRNLLGIFKKQDDASQLIEERRDVVRAAAILEEVPEFLRDPRTIQSLRALEDRAARLGQEIREEQDAGHLTGLRQKVEELDRLTPGRDDLKGMIKVADINEKAQQLVEKHDDHTRALALLEDLPENLRDADLYASLCGRRDRVNTLRREIGEVLGARRISQLRLKIEELTRLQRKPVSDPLTGRTLLEVVSTHEEAHRLAETMRDYAGAIALLDDLPAHLRDGTLYSSLCERRDFSSKQDEARQLIEERRDVTRAAAILEEVPEFLRDPQAMESLRALKTSTTGLARLIREKWKAGHLIELRRSLDELARLTPGRDDLQRMIQAVTKNEEAQKLVENRDDFARALALLDDLPANLRDAGLYASLCGRRDRVNTLRREIAADLGARRISRLRSKIEELTRLQREPVSDPLTGQQLLEVVSTHEEADRLAETMQDLDGAIALLDGLPESLRDASLYPSLYNRRDRVNTLRREIGEDLGARRIGQLRSRIEELSRLQREPISDPLTGRTLLEVVSTHEEADRLAETMRDYAGAIALLDDLPEHLRDGTLYPSLRERGIYAVIDPTEYKNYYRSRSRDKIGKKAGLTPITPRWMWLSAAAGVLMLGCFAAWRGGTFMSENVPKVAEKLNNGSTVAPNTIPSASVTPLPQAVLSHEAWVTHYKSQAPLLTWPANVAERFSSWGPRWPENVHAANVQLAIVDYVEEYPRFVTHVYESLMRPVLRLKPTDPERKSIVSAPPEETLLRPERFSFEKLPSLATVWAAQEKLWVQRNILDTIALANRSATDFDSAVIKRIISLEVANPQAVDRRSSVKAEELEPAPEFYDPNALPPPPSFPEGQGAAAPKKFYVFKPVSKQREYEGIPVYLSVQVSGLDAESLIDYFKKSPIETEVLHLQSTEPSPEVKSSGRGPQSLKTIGIYMMSRIYNPPPVRR